MSDASFSDEEDGVRGDCDGEFAAVSNMREGPNTGPKGVLADYREHQRQRARDQQASYQALLREANRFTLQGNQNSSDNDDKEKELDDSDDEEFMQQYRARRMREMTAAAAAAQRQRTFGQISEVGPDEFVDFIDSEGASTAVVLHLYAADVPECAAMGRALTSLAAKYPTVKFGQAVARALSSKFDTDAGLPALLIYRAGELEHNMVGVTDDLGLDFSRDDVEDLLARYVCGCHVLTWA